MVIGDTTKLSFIIERIPEWEDESFKNGIMFVTVNDSIYPKELRTATLNCEFADFLSSRSAFMVPVCDKELYSKPDEELFQSIFSETYSDGIESYRFLIPFHEINDAGHWLFIVTDGENVKILVGRWDHEADICSFVEAVEISMEEFEGIKTQLLSFARELTPFDWK